MTIYQGDNTGFGGQELLKITISNPDNFIISKAEFKCGSIILNFDNPTFPLVVNLNEEQTEKLNITNKCYLAVYDSEGRKQTCEGTFKIPTNARVI